MAGTQTATKITPGHGELHGGTPGCHCLEEIPGYFEGNDANWDQDETAYRYCGAPTAREFAQGHDARLKSVLIRHHRSGREIHIVDGGGMISTSADLIAAARGWERFLTPGPPRRNHPTRPPKTAPPAPRGPAVEDGTVKIGRWPYKAYRVGTVVHYTDRRGTEHLADTRVAATFSPDRSSHEAG